MLLYRFAIDNNTGEFSQIGNQSDRNLDLLVRIKAFQSATLFDTCNVQIELYYFTNTITFRLCPIGTGTPNPSDIVDILIPFVFSGTATATGTISIADISTNDE